MVEIGSLLLMPGFFTRGDNDTLGYLHFPVTSDFREDAADCFSRS